MVREEKRRIIMTLLDGTPVDHLYQPVKNLSQANRFIHLDHYNGFIAGYYAPKDPTLYKPTEIIITYEVNEDADTES